MVGNVGGGVPFENIKGRALFVWLSIADGVDWSRLGTPVMGRPHLPSNGKALEPQLQKCLQDQREHPVATNPPDRPR